MPYKASCLGKGRPSLCSRSPDRDDPDIVANVKGWHCSVNIRILLADDFAPWRHFVSSMILMKEPQWHIVCEVEDGLEAVSKAKELKPDLILLDIGLDKLNGIEAARQIREFDPNLKILFLSAFDSLEVVEEAINTGANGYVIKLDAANELINSIEAVFQGEQFVSRRIHGRIPARDRNTQASFLRVRDSAVSEPRSSQPPEPERSRCHEVQFYSNDRVFLERVGHFVAAALKFGNAAIVAATKPHRDLLVQDLKNQGVDADALIQQGAYVSLDAAAALSTFMINEWPDEMRFHEVFNKLIESASRAAKATHPRVAIFGEGVAILWAEGKKEAALRVEQLCNDLAQTRRLDIICAYPFSLQIQEDKSLFRAICAEHSAAHVR